MKNKNKWCYGACGEYLDYKKYTIIKNDHPALLKYEIALSSDGSDYGDLIYVGQCSTLKEAKEMINILLKNYEKI